MANAELLKNLKCLMLEANNIGPKGAEALASSPNFQNLEVLFLDSNPIGPEGARVVASSEQLAKFTGAPS